MEKNIKTLAKFTPTVPVKPDIFRYRDYRLFLKDAYQARKDREPNFSHRFLAAKIGFDSGHFSKIISGKRNVTFPMVPKFVDIFKLNKKEKDYFEILIHFAQARNPEDKLQLQKKLDGFSLGKPVTLEPVKYDYYDRWYYSTLRELLNIKDFKGDYDGYGRLLSPPITGTEVREGFMVLLKLGLIKKNSQGKYLQVDPHITSGTQHGSKRVNNFVEAGLNLAREALTHTPTESRNLSTLTVGISERHFKVLQEKIRQFRREFADEIAKVKDKPERVYQLNIQFFPLSQPQKTAP